MKTAGAAPEVVIATLQPTIVTPLTTFQRLWRIAAH